MSKKWLKLSKEDLKYIVETSNSYSEVASKCGYSNVMAHGGGAIDRAKEMIAYYNFDDSHIKEEKWRTGKPENKNKFSYGKDVTPNTLLKDLISIRGRFCEVCKNSIWMGKDIPLEIHHIDGDPLNNNISNLQMICPNCHALTDNYRGKNNLKSKKKQRVKEKDFVEALEKSTNIRQALLMLNLVPKGANYFRAKDLIIKYDIKSIKF